jgi:hypothetical protein
MRITGIVELCICWGRELAEFAKYQSYRVTELFDNLSRCCGGLWPAGVLELLKIHPADLGLCPSICGKALPFRPVVAGSLAASPPPPRQSLKGLGKANGKAELFRK